MPSLLSMYFFLRLDVESFDDIGRQGGAYLVDDGREVRTHPRVFVEIRVGAEFIEQNEDDGKDDDAFGQPQYAACHPVSP